MKLTLIKPNIGRMEHSLYVDEGRMEPLTLAVLAGLTPPDVEVVLYDDRMESIPYDEETDFVAITVETYTARRAYEISAEFRARGIPVIMGGFQPMLIPEECALHADSLLIGDAETIWPDIIADAKSKKLKPLYKARPGIPQAKTLPRRDLFDGKGYLPLSLMQFSRGCTFACNFCAVSVFFDRKQYVRDVRELVREIEAQDRKILFIVDDNIAANHNALKTLCRELIPLNVRWISQTSLNITHDLELMKLMERSGNLGNVVGFESLNLESIRSMNKSPNFSGFDHYKEQVKILNDYGHQTWAAFTLGHDFDTAETVDATLDFAMENNFSFAAFNILMPYPGTPLYEKLKEENRLLYDGKWWLHPEYRFNQAAFLPSKVSPDELTDACHRARSHFNTLSSITRRLFMGTNFRSLSRAGLYLFYASIFRKEVFKKHGMRFGLET